jgi:tryptophan 2,3-dioxygenase
MKDSVYYSDYLQLDKILNAQTLESDKKDSAHAHDEMLFIIIHQAYELWFKQIMYEVESVIQLMSKAHIADNSPALYTIHHRLKRVVTILQLLVSKIDILETMTPLDFLDFRDMLRPASGFQSMQFKILESLLGLRMESRYGKEYYISQLRPEDAQKIRDAEKQKPLIALVNEWLERMPFFDEPKFWPGMPVVSGSIHPFWARYKEIYSMSLAEGEKANLAVLDEQLLSSDIKPGWALSPKARRAALFIMLYRDYPLLQLPFGLLNVLLEIDEGLSIWRYRHMSMVHRIIGMRTGTGGSTGKSYLKGALESHHIFAEFAALTSFLIERNKLPALSPLLKKKLGFGE